MKKAIEKQKKIIMDFFDDDSKKRKLIIILGLIGVSLILLSEIKLPSSDKRKTDYSGIDSGYSDYVKGLDSELTDIISNISGVGECRVMITLKNTNEKIYAQNSENSYSQSSNSKNYEYVFYEGENGDSPILIKENFPAIEGVAIVCSGGDDIAVRENVINCVCALFNISANRVSVSKLTDKG